MSKTGVDVAMPPEAAGMAPADYLAFRTLVERSVRPVDAGYVGKNLRAFRRLLDEGVPADAILEAYAAYADYQHRMLEEAGEMRPMHLLRWLRQSPNSNIQYVLRSRDEDWLEERRRGHGGASRRPTHDDPDLLRCRDRGVATWFVTDERGSRHLEGADGVESPTMVRELYERMYEEETSRKGRR